MKLPLQHSPILFSDGASPPSQQNYIRYHKNKTNNKITIAYSCQTLAVHQRCSNSFTCANLFNPLASTTWTEAKEVSVQQEKQLTHRARHKGDKDHRQSGPFSLPPVSASLWPFPLLFSTLPRLCSLNCSRTLIIIKFLFCLYLLELNFCHQHLKVP